MTEKEFRKAVVQSYEYTHRNCTYGPSGTTYPPGAAPDFVNDCVGLIFLAAYYLGKYPHSITIDEVVNLCISMGFVKSTDENDVWRHPGVSCYQDKNNKETNHVNHVFYSLGGTGLDNISKYDLGSLERIRANQPFEHVQCNEWKDRRNFFCHLYLPEDEKPAIPIKDALPGATGTVLTDCGVYNGPGKDYKRVGKLTIGDQIIVYDVKVTSAAGHIFYYVRRISDGLCGYAYAKAFSKNVSTVYAVSVGGTDGTLNIRQGPGTQYPIVTTVKEGDQLAVLCEALNEDNALWCNVHTIRKKSTDKILYGWCAICHLYDIE